MPGLPSRQAASALCLHCGLCCNGVLFKDVELRTRTEGSRIHTAALPCRTSNGSGEVLARLPQPCAALCADLKCRVYDTRPTRCREFECALFQDVTAGTRPAEAALKIIRRARKRVREVEGLLESLGDTETSRPLRTRFQRTQRRLEINGCDDAEARSFAELSEAMHALNLLLAEHFHP